MEVSFSNIAWNWFCDQDKTTAEHAFIELLVDISTHSIYTKDFWKLLTCFADSLTMILLFVCTVLFLEKKIHLNTLGTPILDSHPYGENKWKSAATSVFLLVDNECGLSSILQHLPVHYQCNVCTGAFSKYDQNK